MPVDWANLAGSLVRTLRANQAESDVQSQLAQEKQKQQLQEGMQQNQFSLDKNYLDFNIQQAQAKQQKVQQLGQATIADLTERWQNATDPAEKADIAARIRYVASGGDPNRALMGIKPPAAAKPPKPPELKFMPVPGGVVPLYGSGAGYAVGIPGVTTGAGAGGSAPTTGNIPGMSIEGGVPVIRNPTTVETAQADAVTQALNQIDALKPEIDAYAAEVGPEPTGTFGKIGAAAGRGAEYYGSYKMLGSTSPHSIAFTDASQLYAQIAGALMKGGTRSIRYLQQLSPHIPKATDSPQLLQEKIGKWRDILQREQEELKRGPFSPASGEGAPAGGGSRVAPSGSSRPEALAPGPKTPIITSAKGYKYYTDSSGDTVFLNPHSGRWEPLD